MSMAQQYIPPAMRNVSRPKDDSWAGVLKSVLKDVVDVAAILGVQVETILNLATTNPLAMGIIGIILINVLGNKVDFLRWQHTEGICLDCAGWSFDPLNPSTVVDAGRNVVGTLSQSGPNLGILQPVIQLAPGVVLGGVLFYGAFEAFSQIAANHQNNSPTGGGPNIHHGPVPGSTNVNAGGGGGNSANHKVVTVWVPGIIPQAGVLQILGLIIANYAVANTGSILGDITQITSLVGGKTSDSANLIRPSVTNLVQSYKGSAQVVAQGTAPSEATTGTVY